MMLKETLRMLVKAQEKELASFEYGIERNLLRMIDLNVPFALAISGIRRCGKSTLLRQVMKRVSKPYYFSFEDPRAEQFEASDFQKLDEVFKDEYGENDCYFFDEIQNASKWELFVRAMLDRKKHFLITGSNASLLSKELGTRLTGRHLRYELFPFSYGEFLEFNRKRVAASYGRGYASRGVLHRKTGFFNYTPGLESFKEYLYKGGFPEYLIFNRVEILQELFNDIITRDIVIRYKLKSSKTIKEMALYLLTNVGKEFSYNGLKKIFNLGSTNTVIDFVSYLEDSYLLFTISKFDYSLKKQIVNPKKVYSIDNGLSSTNSVSFSLDRGRMLENMVFMGLRKKYKEIFYFREKNECDFIVKEKNKVKIAIQVAYEINDDNKEREFNGLLEALEKFNFKEGYILTYNQEDEIKIANKRILLKPVWKWLLEN